MLPASHLLLNLLTLRKLVILQYFNPTLGFTNYPIQLGMGPKDFGPRNRPIRLNNIVRQGTIASISKLHLGVDILVVKYKFVFRHHENIPWRDVWRNLKVIA